MEHHQAVAFLEETVRRVSFFRGTCELLMSLQKKPKGMVKKKNTKTHEVDKLNINKHHLVGGPGEKPRPEKDDFVNDGMMRFPILMGQ